MQWSSMQLNLGEREHCIQLAADGIGVAKTPTVRMDSESREKGNDVVQKGQRKVSPALV